MLLTKLISWGVVVLLAAQDAWAEPPAGLTWELVFSDEFNGTTADLDKNWAFQDGPSGHILCSRWRDNVVAADGLCRLLNKKEQRGGQEWTSGSMWTKRQFRYGYFECRYKYGATTGLNNSFWLMTQGKERPEVPVRFEIDVNEGHYPNEIATNIHKWSGAHTSKSRSFRLGVQAGHAFPLETPVETDRLRLVVRDNGRVRVTELRVFPAGLAGYPALFARSADAPEGTATNLALTSKATASSELSDKYSAAKAIDGRLDADSRWVSNDGPGPHTLTVELESRQRIGCVHLITGTKKDAGWVDPIGDFVLQYWDGHRWINISQAESAGRVDLSREFHGYGLEWNEQELVFYFDGKVLRREPNVFCHGAAPVWLSSAIIKWAGPVTDQIDGTSMDVDWVRVYQRKP